MTPAAGPDPGRPEPGDGAVDRFHDLMGVVDSTMLIVTTVGATGERSGCMVGFATQCSIDPARFLVCLSDKNHTYRVARRATHLGVHLIPADRHDLAEHFGSTTGDEIDTFAGVAWHEGPAGVPLVEGCPDWFVGRIDETTVLGDHVGFVLSAVGATGHVVEGPVLRLHDVADIDPGHSA
jgi:flavin reductase (DIM6/NTAB) family NADH-FMN oxidoreductase RutF